MAMKAYKSIYSFNEGFCTADDILKDAGGKRFILADRMSFFAFEEFAAKCPGGIFANTLALRGGEAILVPRDKGEFETMARCVSLLLDGDTDEKDVLASFEKLPPAVLSCGIDPDIRSLISERALCFEAEETGIDFVNALTRKAKYLSSVLLPAGRHPRPEGAPARKEEFDAVLNGITPFYDMTADMIPVFSSDDPGLLRKTLRNALRHYNGGEEAYAKRLEYETDTVISKGLSGFFLIVADLVREMRMKGVGIGPARGSAAGALISFLLGITKVDPLKYGLSFERFLNPERDELPDIDIDFSYRERPDVFRYLERKYSGERTGHLSAVVTYGYRGAMRYLQRMLKWNLKKVETLCGQLPSYYKGPPERTLELHPNLGEIIRKDAEAAYYFRTASLLVGLPCNYCVHPSGFLVLKHPAYGISALHAAANGERIMHLTKDTGFRVLKIDCLGLRYLSVIGDTVRDRGEDPEAFAEKTALDDPEAFGILRRTETTGVFELESNGLRAYMRKLKPSKIEDIMAMVSLYRPGPLEGGIISEFIARRNGISPVGTMHPALTEILGGSYGLILFQEQVMEIAVKAAGFGWGKANTLRRAMTKRDRKAMFSLREDFIRGFTERYKDEAKAREIWVFLEKFANYGFNRAHAAGYALLAYYCAYLKAHDPLPYFKNLLNAFIDMPGMVQNYIFEAQRNGIRVAPPDINRSGAVFSEDGHSITAGFCSVKGLSAWARKIAEIMKGMGRPLRSYDDLILGAGKRGVRIPRDIMWALIHCGVFSDYGSPGELIKRFCALSAAGPGDTLFAPPGELLYARRPHYMDPAFSEYVYSLPLEVSKHGDRVTVKGYITKTRGIRTRKGKMMVFASIANERAEYECAFFGNNALAILKGGWESSPVTVSGVMDYDRQMINVRDVG